jgi:peptide/nickel transport system permease protein
VPACIGRQHAQPGTWAPPHQADAKEETLVGYIARRIGTAVIVVVGISIGTFGLLHVIYPSPAIDVLGAKANTAAIAAWNKANGFDNPWFVQYLHYMNNLLHGNLGYSYKVNQSVSALFQERWARSAYLSGISLVLAVVIAIPLGIFQAVRRNTAGDYVATSAAFVLYAMPVFLLGLILIQFFALDLHWFGYEASQSNSVWAVMGDFRDMTLPILTLTLISVAQFSRYMRSQSMDVLAQDYIKVAKAKGLPQRLVLARHLVRNASLPMVTLVGLSIPSLLAGNLITETLFNFQGLGLLFYNSLNNVDYDVLLAYTLLGALLTVIGNLLADVALTVADPRIRLA